MFTLEQINKLRDNKNVVKCSSKAITYDKEFKLRAVKQYYEENYSPRMIFEEAGFDLSAIGIARPKDCLRLWKRIYSSQGEEELSQEHRGLLGGRKRIKIRTKLEEVEYLKTKIAYLEAENDFLAKLRGLKRE